MLVGALSLLDDWLPDALNPQHLRRSPLKQRFWLVETMIAPGRRVSRQPDALARLGGSRNRQQSQ